MLIREMSHRVKNSLASVVGLLPVQSRSAQSEEVQNALHHLVESDPGSVVDTDVDELPADISALVRTSPLD
jgi:hypothetical protein